MIPLDHNTFKQHNSTHLMKTFGFQDTRNLRFLRVLMGGKWNLLCSKTTGRGIMSVKNHLTGR